MLQSSAQDGLKHQFRRRRRRTSRAATAAGQEKKARAERFVVERPRRRCLTGSRTSRASASPARRSRACWSRRSDGYAPFFPQRRRRDAALRVRRRHNSGRRQRGFQKVVIDLGITAGHSRFTKLRDALIRDAQSSAWSACANLCAAHRGAARRATMRGVAGRSPGEWF